jgi:hypothetical protein
MGPYNTSSPTDTDSTHTLLFYNDVYANISKLNLDKENSISNINVYKKTKMFNKIFYIIIIVCVIVILLTFLNKTFKYFDDVAYLIICGVLLGVAILYVGYILWDLYFRSELNFDEYDYSKFGTYNPPLLQPNSNKNYSDISGNIKCASSINESINKSFFKQLF